MIAPDTLVPDLLTRHPGARGVFDRYGLKGCGGPLGPRETVAFFARVHRVPLDRLLAELEAAKDAPAPDFTEGLADILYRACFRAAIVVFLGVGILLGAASLWIATLRAVPPGVNLTGLVHAHANAQLFGWIGLFIMGFAGQGLPRFKYTTLWRPRLVALALPLMLLGIALHLALLIDGLWFAAAGGVLQAASAALFATVMAKTLAGTPRDSWDRYVVAAIGAFALAAALEPVVLLGVYLADWPASLLPAVRDFTLVAVGGLMVLGVGQRILPVAFGFREASRAASLGAFILLAGGVPLWLAAPLFGLPAWPGAALVAAGALWMALELRGFTGGDAFRSTKFIRSAFAWLAVAMALLVAGAPPSAFRHAFALGFLSLMIVGVSSKVVAVLGGGDLAALPPLRVTFLLVNAAVALRVGGILLDRAWLGAASAIVAVAGFLPWAVQVWRLTGGSPGIATPRERPAAIDASLTPAAVIGWWPQTLDVFLRFGFAPLANPLLRATLGRRVTLRTACAMKNVDAAALVAALNEAIRPTAASFEV